MVLIDISLMTNDVEHISVYLSTTCVSSLQKGVSISVLCPFENWAIFSGLSGENSFYILGTRLSSHNDLQISLMVSFDAHWLLTWRKSNLSIFFASVSRAFGATYKNQLLNTRS